MDLHLQVNKQTNQLGKKKPVCFFFQPGLSVLESIIGSLFIILSTYNPVALLTSNLQSTTTLSPSSSTTTATLMSNQVVFFDVAIGGRPAGRIEMTLFSDVCPRTCENFRVLCKWTIIDR